MPRQLLSRPRRPAVTAGGVVAGLLATAALTPVSADAHVATTAGPAAAQAALAPEGTLDPSFSADAPRAGITTPLPARQYVDVAVQHDGKVVAVSSEGNDFFVSRFNPNGTPDTGFSITGTGSVAIDVAGAGQVDRANAVAIDSQNRIVVVGSGGAAVPDFALVRLSPDGKAAQINTHVHVGNAPDPATAVDVAFQSDGTIVVAGTAQVSGDSDFAIVQFHGTTGAVVGSPRTRSLGTGNESASAVAVHGRGPHQDKIVVVGTTGSLTVGSPAIGIAQWLPTTGIDNTFNGTGQRIVDPTAGDDRAGGVATTPNGSIVVAGYNGAADRDVVVARLLPTGGFDGTFNLGAPRTITRPGADSVRSQGLAVQRDGKIIVAADIAAAVDVGVFRLNANGATDTAFGMGGVTVVDVDGNDDANAVALDRFGRILVAGDDTASSGFVARLLGPDSDGDGVRDADDACPAVAGPLANGCAPPQAVLKGKKVVIKTVLAKKRASAKCPAEATVTVKTKTKQGPLTVVKQLKTKKAGAGCSVKGKVRLSAKPKKSAKTTVKITGTRLKTKRLVAVRL